MSVESELQVLTATLTTLTTNVGIQQTGVNTAVGLIAATTTTVNTELNLVDNTADVDKPVSTAQQTAIDLKQNTLVSGTNIRTLNGQPLLGSTDISIVLESVDSELIQYEDRDQLRTDPASPYEEKNTIKVEGIGELIWYTTTEEPDDDETCFTSDTNLGQWRLSEPAYDLLQAHAMVEKSFRNELDEDEADRIALYLTTQGLI